MYDLVVFQELMRVLSLGEGLGEYQVGVAVVSDHNVLVTTACMNWEATCVLSIQFTDGCHLDVQLI